MRMSLGKLTFLEKKKEEYKRCPEDVPEDAFSILLDTLIAYEELNKTPVSPTLKLFSKRKQSVTEKSQNEKKRPMNMGSASRYVTFYILNLTLNEIYDSYKKFYQQFDDDDSLRLDKDEFYALLDYFAKPENMGKEKVKKSFEILDKEAYENHIQYAVSNNTNRLEPGFKEAMFISLSINTQGTSNTGSKTQNKVVNYLKFLPMMMSYFGEFIRKGTETRITNLEMIRGLDLYHNALEAHQNSFIAKLQNIGIKFDKKADPPRVTFKQLEKALITFRNSFTDTFSNDQLYAILKELKQKLKILPNDNFAKKTAVLNFNLINWISYRICVHCSLFNLTKTHRESNPDDPNSKVPRFVILEEYTVWAAAYNSFRFNEECITQRFLKYAKKRIDLDADLQFDKPEDEETLKEIFKGFIRKIFPHISSVSITNMFVSFRNLIMGISIEGSLVRKLGQYLDGILVQEATEKLENLIVSVHKEISKEIKKLHEKKPTIGDSSKHIYTYGLSLETKKTEGNENATEQGGEALDTINDDKNSTLLYHKYSLKNKGTGSSQEFSANSLNPEKFVDSPVIEAAALNLSMYLPPSSDSPASVDSQRRRASLSSALHIPIDFTNKGSDEKALSHRLSAFHKQKSSVSNQDSDANNYASLSNMGTLESSRSRANSATSPKQMARLQFCGQKKQATKKVSVVKGSNMYNESTKRQPDLLNSFFIMESFLEKHIKRESVRNNDQKFGNWDGEDKKLLRVNEEEEILSPDTKRNKELPLTLDFSRQSSANRKLALSLAKRSSNNKSVSSRPAMKLNFENEELVESSYNLDDIVFKRRIEPPKGREGIMCGYVPCKTF